MSADTKHTVIITERKRAEISGVSGILSFDESYISLDTSLGRLVIEGEGLRVEDLSRESGRINLVGDISAVYYEKKREKHRLFAKE